METTQRANEDGAASQQAGRAPANVDGVPHELTEPEAAFLNALFAGLRAGAVRYAVMRNAAPLPGSLGGSDLDLLVDPSQARAAQAIVVEAARRAGGTVVGCAESLDLVKVFLLGCGRAAWWGARVDLNIGWSYRGARCFVASEVLRACTVERDGVAVLAPEVAAVLAALKEVLFHAVIPARYLAEARQAVAEQWDHIGRVLRPMGGHALAALRRAIERADVPGAQARAATLRRALAMEALRREPAGYVRRRAALAWTKVRRVARPSGAVVAILGVDGVGKSTVVGDIEPVLRAATHGAVVSAHLRPGLLPPPAHLWPFSRERVGAAFDPHGLPASGPIVSVGRMAFYTLDYVLGYWVRVRPSIAREPAVWVFDRYAYDMAIDARRFRMGAPRSVARAFTRLAPRPDLIVCLHATPEIIAARKQELSRAEIERQLREIRQFARSEPRAVLVSTDAGRKEVRDRVLQAMFDFFQARARRAHG